MKSEFKKLENVGAKCCVKIEPKTKFALKSFSENKLKIETENRKLRRKWKLVTLLA